MKREEIKNFLKEVLSGLEEHDELSVIRNNVMNAALELGRSIIDDLQVSDYKTLLPLVKRFEERVNKAFNL